jgi:hypothetical protein
VGSLDECNLLEELADDVPPEYVLGIAPEAEGIVSAKAVEHVRAEAGLVTRASRERTHSRREEVVEVGRERRLDAVDSLRRVRTERRGGGARTHWSSSRKTLGEADALEMW